MPRRVYLNRKPSADLFGPRGACDQHAARQQVFGPCPALAYNGICRTEKPHCLQKATDSAMAQWAASQVNAYTPARPLQVGGRALDVNQQLHCDVSGRRASKFVPLLPWTHARWLKGAGDAEPLLAV